MNYLETSNILDNIDPSNYNFVYNRTMTFNMTSTKPQPSQHRQLHIQFDFVFESKHTNISKVSYDDSTLRLYRQDIPSLNDGTVSTTVVVDESSSLLVDDIVFGFHEAIGNRLSDDDRMVLVCRAVEELNESFPNNNPPGVVLEGKALPQFTSLHMCFEIWTVHLRINAICRSTEYPIRPVEKREAVCGNDGEEEKRCCEGRRCCICLKGIHGCSCRGGEMRMPCSHFFHGDCIKNWLTTSNYCPLCRYEMPALTPTQE